MPCDQRREAPGGEGHYSGGLHYHQGDYCLNLPPVPGRPPADLKEGIRDWGFVLLVLASALKDGDKWYEWRGVDIMIGLSDAVGRSKG